MKLIKSVQTLVSTSTLCAMLAFSNIAFVHAADQDSFFDSPRHHKKSGELRDYMIKRMSKVLALSEQQQVQIKAIKTLAKERHKSLHESLKQFKKEAKLLIQADSFDEQAFIALQGAYQVSFEQVVLVKAKTKHAIFNLLTIEQQLKWQTMEKKRRTRANTERG
ncbi:MAG: Spy/CpxP family protein refolding chaperone [Colwellia sp.]|nr:Spy/CpxP family protein refolding chaperone [Colwellia sp.]